MRTSPSKSVLSRRLAAAVVLPGLLTSSLVLIQPAAAAGTTSNSSICNGVVNQQAHRGGVQENLLKAVAVRVQELLRSGECRARMGGAYIEILLEGAFSPHDLARIGRRVG